MHYNQHPLFAHRSEKKILNEINKGPASKYPLLLPNGKPKDKLASGPEKVGCWPAGSTESIHPPDLTVPVSPVPVCYRTAAAAVMQGIDAVAVAMSDAGRHSR